MCPGSSVAEAPRSCRRRRTGCGTGSCRRSGLSPPRTPRDGSTEPPHAETPAGTQGARSPRWRRPSRTSGLRKWSRKRESQSPERRTHQGRRSRRIPPTPRRPPRWTRPVWPGGWRRSPTRRQVRGLARRTGPGPRLEVGQDDVRHVTVQPRVRELWSGGHALLRRQGRTTLVRAQSECRNNRPPSGASRLDELADDRQDGRTRPHRGVGRCATATCASSIRPA